MSLSPTPQKKNKKMFLLCNFYNLPSPGSPLVPGLPGSPGGPLISDAGLTGQLGRVN